MAKSKNEGKTTQKEMVRDALDEKGWKVPPLELQDFIKDKFGVELANNIISNYKSVIKREGGMGAATATAGRKAAGGLKLADLEAVQGLVSRLGSEQVKKLVEMAEMFE